MAFTQLLLDQTYGSLSFTEVPINNLIKKFSLSKKVIKENVDQLQNGGEIYSDVAQLSANKFYYLSNWDPLKNVKRELWLPKNPRPGQFVAVIWDTLATIHFVSRDTSFPVFKFRGHGEKIMDMHEDLTVDIPFHRLQLAYHSPARGWIIS